MKVYIISAKGYQYDPEFVCEKGFRDLQAAKEYLVQRFNFEDADLIEDRGGLNSYGTRYSIREIEVE